MTETCKKAYTVALANNSFISPLECVPCIYYRVLFKKDQAKTQTLIDSGSKVNAINPAYAARLGLKVRSIDVGAQKIDGSILKTFKMILASFQVEDKLVKARFFEKTFLLADTTVVVILGILFLIFSNADMLFVKRELTWRSYITTEALPTIKQVELMNKKEFTKIALDENSEIFVMHVAALETLLAEMMIYPS